MMKIITNLMYAITFMIVGTASGFSLSNAATISYEGDISIPFGTVTGSVGSRSWIEEIAAETDFWSFDVGQEGVSLDVWALRGDQSLDTVFTVYSGTTSADESEFKNQSNFGGMTVFRVADDQIPDTGPFGDPALYNVAFPEGTYTIAIGGYASSGDGPYTYKLSIGTPGSAPGTGNAPIIPIPGAFWLLATGFLGLVSTGRLKQ